MPDSIREEAREVPVAGKWDVLVVGGGLGGVAAATAAARAGATTLLVERNAFLGGVATAGLCCSVFNSFFTSEGRLGTTGLALEVADRLAEATGYGLRWRNHKGHIIYDLEAGKLVLQRLVAEAGAQTLLQACGAAAFVEDSAVKGVVVETKTGRQALLADVVVDCTADADIAATSGAPLRVFEQGSHSLCFRLGNVDVDAFVGFFRAHPDQFPEYMDVDWSLTEALAQYDDCGTFLFPHGGGMQLEAFQRAKAEGALPARVGLQDTTDACQMHALRQTGTVHVITGFTHFDGLDPTLISASLGDGREMAATLTDVYRKYLPGFERAFLADTATNLGVRVSRYLDGDFSFTAECMGAGVRQPDAIGRLVGWDAVVKHPGAGAWASQVLRADSFDVPYRCLVPREVDGLLVGCGRSVSSENPWLLRAMVQTLVVGQGAGAAAAIAAKTGTTPREVDVAAVQAELRRAGGRVMTPATAPGPVLLLLALALGLLGLKVGTGELPIPPAPEPRELAGVHFNPTSPVPPGSGHWLVDYHLIRDRVNAELADLVRETGINFLDVMVLIPYTLREPGLSPSDEAKDAAEWANLRTLDNLVDFLDYCHTLGVSVEVDLATNQWIPFSVDTAQHIGASEWWPEPDDTPWSEAAVWYTQLVQYVETRVKHPEAIALWVPMGNYHWGGAEPVTWDFPEQPEIGQYTERFLKYIWPRVLAAAKRPVGSPIMLPIFADTPYWSAKPPLARLSSFSNVHRWLVADLRLPPDYWVMSTYPCCDPAPDGVYYLSEIVRILAEGNSAPIISTDFKGAGHSLEGTILDKSALSEAEVLRWHFAKGDEYGFAGWWMWAYQDTATDQTGLRRLDGEWKRDLTTVISKRKGDF